MDADVAREEVRGPVQLDAGTPTSRLCADDSDLDRTLPSWAQAPQRRG
jgi:hypothetical protein